MKAKSIEEVEAYLFADQLKIFGVQDYSVIEFEPHYSNPIANEWFKN